MSVQNVGLLYCGYMGLDSVYIVNVGLWVGLIKIAKNSEFEFFRGWCW